MHIVTAAMIAAITITAPAAALPVPGTATLAAPAAHDRVVGESGVWRCTGATCTGPSDDRARMAVATCAALAGVNGRIERFTAGPADFGASELARCNRHVAK